MYNSFRLSYQFSQKHYLGVLFYRYHSRVPNQRIVPNKQFLTQHDIESKINLALPPGGAHQFEIPPDFFHFLTNHRTVLNQIQCPVIGQKMSKHFEDPQVSGHHLLAGLSYFYSKALIKQEEVTGCWDAPIPFFQMPHQTTRSLLKSI